MPLLSFLFKTAIIFLNCYLVHHCRALDKISIASGIFPSSHYYWQPVFQITPLHSLKKPHTKTFSLSCPNSFMLCRMLRRGCFLAAHFRLLQEWARFKFLAQGYGNRINNSKVTIWTYNCKMTNHNYQAKSCKLRKILIWLDLMVIYVFQSWHFLHFG